MSQYKNKASVIIPTYNGGALFDRVAEAVSNQLCDFTYDVLVIDSSSKDDTKSVAEKYGFNIHSISQSEFQHGRTRNLGVSMCDSEFAVFLTQDAMPSDDLWLYKMIHSLSQHKSAAGIVGRQIAWDTASPFTIRDTANHFNHRNSLPKVISKYTDEAKWVADQGWRQMAHFYSDNNACFRKSIWEKFPYPEINFGEDQVWAKTMLDEGYGIAYSNMAAVFHSHDYGVEETKSRSMVDFSYYKKYFGYELGWQESDLKKMIEVANSHDQKWGKKNDVTSEQINLRCQLNEARLLGNLAGSKLDDVPNIF